MNRLEEYTNQFKSLVQKILLEGPIDEYGDEEVYIYFYQPTTTLDTIKEITKIPTIKDFFEDIYAQPLTLVEVEDGMEEPFSESRSLTMLAEYIERGMSCEVEKGKTGNEINTQVDPHREEFYKKTTLRTEAFLKQFMKEIESGIELPILENESVHTDPKQRMIDNANREITGVIYYDKNRDQFKRVMKTGAEFSIPLSEAMLMAFDYYEERTKARIYTHKIEKSRLENKIEQGQQNQRSLDLLPQAYKNAPTYRECTIKPNLKSEMELSNE